MGALRPLRQITRHPRSSCAAPILRFTRALCFAASVSLTRDRHAKLRSSLQQHCSPRHRNQHLPSPVNFVFRTTSRVRVQPTVVQRWAHLVAKPFNVLLSVGSGLADAPQQVSSQRAWCYQPASAQHQTTQVSKACVLRDMSLSLRTT